MASPSSLRWSISDRSWDEMNATDRERLLADLLPLLAACGMAKASADRSSPLTDLQLECRSIVCDEVRRRDVRSYLSSYPIVCNSVATLLAQLAMAASVKWQDL